MAGSATTLWASDRDRAADDARTRAVALGLLDRAAAAEALERWRDEGGGAGFVTFLVAHGLLQADDAARLAAAAFTGPIPEVEAGQRLSGCTLLRRLGQGGMGVVWSARRDDGATVVVKLLAPQHARNPLWRARFAREGLVASRIVHENVVRVFAVEVEGPHPHLVMELVEGQDLADRLEAEGPLPPLEAARLARDAARGLSAAHALGVVHRDVKPGNVRVTPEGRVKLLDFGLARGVEVEEGISIAGQVMGTPHYMPPEQWGDHRVDARADVYSLGATLYHLVTGAPPFPQERPMAICRKVLAGDFPRPRALAPELPEALELVILRMMALDRRCRYPTAAEAADDLDAVLAGGPVRVPALVEVAGGRRHALLPGTTFLVGSDTACPVRLAGLAPRHARLDIGRTGFQLTDLGGGSRVDGMPVTRAQLKPGDLLALGPVELRFDDAGVAAAIAGTRPLDGARLKVQALPWPFVSALVEQRDRRVVVPLLERLPLVDLERQAASSRVWLREALGDGALAEAAAAHLLSSLRVRRARACEALFRITHENLGEDEEDWLAWWVEAAAAYPPQVAPISPHPARRLRIEGDGPPRVVDLDDRALHRIGRGADCDVRLDQRSVSRHHASLVRLDRRLVVQDEGSRFGTRLRGLPVRAAFLHPGEHVTLGLVSLTLLAEDLELTPPRAPDGAFIVAPALFEALVALRHRAAATALARLARAPQRLAWVSRLAGELQPEAARAAALATAVTRAYSDQAALAVSALAELAPGVPPEEVARLPDLPPQVVPAGWLAGAVG